MGKPAARITDMHVCPMVTGLVPHVGGPIIPPCCVTVLTGWLPAARIGDMAICVGPLDIIIQGSPTVLIGGKPAARIGDATAHGGVIVTGLPTVLIGESGGGGGSGGSGAPVQPKVGATAAASEQRPELEQIANDPVVAAAIEQSWNASNPNGPGAKQEKGFWVVKDKKTGELSVVQFPDNGTNDSLTPGDPPNSADKEVAAFFHTHPNTAEEGYASGPSDADKDFAAHHGAPGIIKSHDGMYYFGPKK